jgi:hypothetical protein
MQSHEFETSAATSPPSLAWGFIEIDDIPSIRARVICAGEGDDIAEVSIIGLDQDSIGDTSLLQIKMYRVPAADKAFADDLKSIDKNAKPIDPNVLLPANIPPHWRHKAVTSDEGIVHAWRGGSRALIIRYVLDIGDALTFPMFTWATERIRVVTAWRFDPPTADADAPPQLPMRHRPLEKTEMEQLAANAMRARNSLQLSPTASDEQILSALHAAVDQVRPTFATLKPNIRHNMTVSLGSLWGVLLVNATPWRWCELLRGDADEGFLALVSPDAAYAISPVDFFTKLMTQSPDHPDNTVHLLFNMIVAANLPPSRAGAYKMLS